MYSTPTFLVLDDDAEMRFLHRRELEHEFPGCFVVECESTEEALTRSATVCLDIVLTDHCMRGEDGARFIARLRERGIRCAVVMITGSPDPNVHAQAYAAGASRVFFGTKQGFAPLLRPMLQEMEAATVA